MKKVAAVLREVVVSGWSFDRSIRSLRVDLSDYGVHGWHLNLFALIMYEKTFLFLWTFLKFCSFLTFFRKVWFVCISLPICGLGGGFSFVPIMPDLVRSARWVFFFYCLIGKLKKKRKQGRGKCYKPSRRPRLITITKISLSPCTGPNYWLSETYEQLYK